MHRAIQENYMNKINLLLFLIISAFVLVSCAPDGSSPLGSLGIGNDTVTWKFGAIGVNPPAFVNSIDIPYPNFEHDFYNKEVTAVAKRTHGPNGGRSDAYSGVVYYEFIRWGDDTTQQIAQAKESYENSLRQKQIMQAEEEQRHQEGQARILQKIHDYIDQAQESARKRAQEYAMERTQRQDQGFLDPCRALHKFYYTDYGNYTDLQKEEIFKTKILGHKVHWRLQLDKVKSTSDGFEVTTDTDSCVDAYVYVSSPQPNDRNYLLSKKAGDWIEFEGVIKDDFLRHFRIKDARLIY